jgi:hypothetical protein
VLNTKIQKDHYPFITHQFFKYFWKEQKQYGCVIPYVIYIQGKLAAGVDGITDRVIKQRIKYIKKPLAHIHNVSFESGIFPERLKRLR